MLTRVFCALLLLCLYSSGSSLSCRWIDHKFRDYSENSLDLLEMMVNNSTNTTEDAEENTVAFPHHLYNQTSAASAEDKVAFTVQVLREVCALFEEDDSSSSWQERTLENFLNVVNRQADQLHSCIRSPAHKKNTKLHMYFKRLTNHILKKMGHSAGAWELIRQEIKAHLLRADQLVSTLLPSS
ncbi:interferon a3-like [Cololabis saira]|uniref:interferon a3-like n=1 Tax=Cololabis saira TaxID=129043 RepID=UPI002AD34AD8|nr:interferon a3-like [Cololabis saira]